MQGLSPAEVIAGYEKAALKAIEILPDLVCHTVSNVRDHNEVAAALKTCLQSKQYGYEQFLADLVAKACIEAMPEEGQPFNVDYVRVVKVRHETLRL